MAVSADRWALISAVRERLLEASRSLDREARERVVELAAGSVEEPANSLTTPLLGQVFARWELGADEVLILAAALACELSPPLLRALSILAGHENDRRLSVAAVAALLADGEDGIVRAHELLRRAGPLVDLALVSLGSEERPFSARSIIIDSRLTELALDRRSPLEPLNLFEAAAVPKTATPEMQRLFDALERRASVVALMPAPLDLDRLAADLGPGALLAVPLSRLDDAVSDVLREARIFDATVAVSIDRPLSPADVGSLTAILRQRPMVCVTTRPQLARVSGAIQINLARDYSTLAPNASSPRTLATVAGSAAILPRSIDNLNRGDASGSVLTTAPDDDGELGGDEHTVIDKVVAAWKARAPGTFRVGLIGHANPAEIGASVVRRARRRPVVLDCEALRELDVGTVERTWTDARNAASQDCGVVVVLEANTPRRAILTNLLEGGLFVLVGPHSVDSIIESACDQVHRFGKPSDIDDILAVAHGVEK